MDQRLDRFEDIREMNRRLDPFKDIREMTAALDVFKAYRELTDRLTRSAVLSVTHRVAAASGSVEDILTDVNADLEDGSSLDVEPLSQWLALFPPLAQRRLFLLALTALWAIDDAVDSFAGLSQPDHLDKVIVALLAIATFLSESLGEPPPSD
jgi:hypothetical protein